jgi:hypothetical protein
MRLSCTILVGDVSPGLDLSASNLTECGLLLLDLFADRFQISFDLSFEALPLGFQLRFRALPGGLALLSLFSWLWPETRRAASSNP